MTRALYLVGEPGVGKSTAVSHLTDHLPLTDAHTLDPATPLLKGRTWPGGVVLGGDHPTFPGTDRLSMAVAPQAAQWAATSNLPPVIIAEGQRLAVASFFAALQGRTGYLTVIYLTAAPAVTQQRRETRGTAQNPQWVRGSRTKAHNAAEAARVAGAQVIDLDVSDLRPAAVARAILHIWNRSTPIT